VGSNVFRDKLVRGAGWSPISLKLSETAPEPQTYIVRDSSPGNLIVKGCEKTKKQEPFRFRD
jgi:hypothetical protein